MWYILASLLGMLGGAICVYLAFEHKRRLLNEQAKKQSADENRLQEGLRAITTKQRQIDAEVVSYRELQAENTILKRDLRNIDVNLRKLELDREKQRLGQAKLDQLVRDLGGRYLKDNVKWTTSSLTPNNFAKCKQRLQKVIKSCRDIDLRISTEEENVLMAAMREEYEKVVRADFERQEQARIKAQIREEQKLEREIERELSQLDRERAAIQAALDKAIAEAKDEYSAEVEGLRARLAEAEEKSQRATSRAQMTKSGHVYVISNIGSFGDGVFKIGMTRRLDPLVRVKELGDASVPFPFDVHMMISSDDAPSLENALHRTLHKQRLNKCNPRKEFFRTDIDTVHRIAEKHKGEVAYVADAEALEYRQSLAMPEEDEEFIESVYDRLDNDGEPSSADA